MGLFPQMFILCRFSTIRYNYPMNDSEPASGYLCFNLILNAMSNPSLK